jgi:hypothetical protein
MMVLAVGAGNPFGRDKALWITACTAISCLGGAAFRDDREGKSGRLCENLVYKPLGVARAIAFDPANLGRKFSSQPARLILAEGEPFESSSTLIKPSNLSFFGLFT